MNRGEGSRVTHNAECSTLRVLGAVAHAIDKATGVWIRDLPITPEKILKAIRAKPAPEEQVDAKDEADLYRARAAGPG